ncbi:hypothetical protein Moror_16190 [Moniliophthora roreri MCA 2997]|uniref:Uncharacterized protein n=2 Tax=Moniliophthora roreri TaxID=221103 RepID=V2XA95_MONRO|nr:hypothetical protein Moror_16190 [Moniliophthora roreri MCA 2997]KAI3615136.1 hypothetical protein WG66_016824 [Moniliophthora roreri]
MSPARHRAATPVFSPFLLILSLFLGFSSAQKNKIFQWQFSNNALSTSLPSCAEFPIVVKPYNPNNNTKGVPPFYMIAYEIGGTPRISLLGQNESDLKWTVDHPIGTQLALSVVDSEGTAGGVPPELYTVVTGQSTNCIVSGNSTDFTVSANVTTSVNTCDPWGIRIHGGVKPYNITFLQVNSPVVTNVTLGANDDAFTYINRGDPGKLFIAAVNDLTGRYAFGTPTMMPEGSSDVECVGLVSRPGNAAQLDQEAAAAQAQDRRRRTAIIAGTVAPIASILIGASIAAWYFLYYRRRRSQTRDIDLSGHDTDMTVKPFTGAGPLLYSAGSRSPKFPGGGSYNDSEPHGYSNAPFDPYNGSDNGNATMRPPSESAQSSATGRYSRRMTKAAEAGMASSTVDGHSRSKSHDYNAGPSGSGTRTTSMGTTHDGEPELIIQHRDGGPGRVRELPPPYADQHLQDS